MVIELSSPTPAWAMPSGVKQSVSGAASQPVSLKVAIAVLPISTSNASEKQFPPKYRPLTV